MTLLTIVFALAFLAMGVTPKPAYADDHPAVRLFAAGSLQAALGEISNQFLTAQKIRIETVFGPSGTLRDRLEKGERGDLFAPSDIGHPLPLPLPVKAGPVVLFARNGLCAML